MAPLLVQKLLLDHARTFALTLRLLPPSLREPLSVAYLLARTSDTVADSGRITHERRVALLEELGRALESGDSSCWRPGFKPEELSASEYELLAALPELIHELEQQSDRAELLRLLRTILEGQLLDLRRFRNGGPPLTKEELDRYCWLVAGSVGEIWSLLIAKHEPLHFPSRWEDVEQMREWGISYGKGLQLLNILRDRAEDQKRGRVYIQERDVPEMIEVASGWLDQGRNYCASLAPGRIRYATEIPLRLAMKTLDRIRLSSKTARVKMPRWEVMAILIGTLPSLVLPRRCNRAS